MNACAIIFSNIHDADLPELTKVRTIASVPFAGRYRFIDFMLSNLVNAGVTNVGIITKSNYQSLMDHLGTGKEWDLARKKGGLRIIPPFGVRDSSFYSTRLEALKGSMSFLRHAQDEYVVMTDSDSVCNMNLEAVYDHHIAANADITLVYKKFDMEKEDCKRAVIISEENGRVTDIMRVNNPKGVLPCALNIWIMKKDLLKNLVDDAISHNLNSFVADVVKNNLNNYNIQAYEHKGYYGIMSSLANYYKNSMDLLREEVRDELFGDRVHNVYTKVKDSAPTKYCQHADVKNSFISDGCIIDGTVENSIISRGVNVGKGAVVRNSIIFQDGIIGRGAELNCVIADKNVSIREGVRLSGCAAQPYYIDKGKNI